MKLKKILPFEDYIITSNLSVEQVKSRLSEKIMPKTRSIFTVFAGDTDKPYQGVIYGNSFEVSRIIAYKNSFLPIINGDIFPYKDQTNIKIKMAPNRTVLVLWYGLTFIASLSMTVLSGIFGPMQSKGTALPFAGAELLIFVPVFLIVPLVAFKTESKKSKKFLSALFEATDRPQS
jgi:hypothetical protein